MSISPKILVKKPIYLLNPIHQLLKLHNTSLDSKTFLFLIAFSQQSKQSHKTKASKIPRTNFPVGNFDSKYNIKEK
jgi:hypothetical protein